MIIWQTQSHIVLLEKVKESSLLVLESRGLSILDKSTMMLYTGPNHPLLPITSGIFSVSISSHQWWGPAQCQPPAGAVRLQEDFLPKPYTGMTAVILYVNRSDMNRYSLWFSPVFGSSSSWRVWEPNAGPQMLSTPCTPSTRGDCSSLEPATNSSSRSLLLLWWMLMIPPATLGPSAWTFKENMMGDDVGGKKDNTE